ncbi:MAG: hypothetical protein P9L92_01690 [Candidatus Electryonea clarkiae]|nr:hypothetical protein [Candidatus Electryonea clarkiae]MDP8285377.1 hypothetical protein [Candidatus Electryonea clarkiae]
MRSNSVITQFVTLVSLALFSIANADDWQTITSGWQPQRIAATDEGLWAASDGGLFYINADDNYAELWNKDQGLFSNSVNVVAVHPSSQDIWVCYSNGALDRLDGLNGNILQRTLDFYDDSDIFSIYDIAFSDDAVFIATDIGVSRLELSVEEELWVVKETYRRFGNWTQPSKILSMHISDSLLFVGGESGVAIANLNSILLNPESWQLFNIGEEIPAPDGLNDPKINFIDEADNVVYIGLFGLGMYRFTGSEFNLIPRNYTVYGIETGLSFTNPDDPEKPVYVAAREGLGSMADDGNSWDYFLTDTMRVYDMQWYRNELWFVFDTGNGYIGGIGKYDGESVEFLPQNTPGGNGIYDIDVTSSGDIWITAFSDNIQGAFRWKDGIWTSVTGFDIGWRAFIYDPYAISSDDRGGVWIGTRGSGLINIVEDDNELIATHFDASFEYLEPMNIGSDFMLVSGFAIEPDKGIWMTNTLANDGAALVYVPLEWYDNNDVEWLRFGRASGINSTGLKDIVRDNFGRLWMGAFQSGSDNPIVMFDPRGTPEDTTGDFAVDFGVEVDFRKVNAMRIDQEGLLWVATPVGLYYVNTNLQEPGEFTFMKITGALGDEITALAIDPLDNLWIGTRFGLSVLAPDRFSWIRNYTSSSGQYPSSLVDDEISTLEFSPSTGEIYIGTGQGISILQTPYRPVGKNLMSSIEVRPQPFKVGADMDSKLYFTGNSLVRDAKVKIFTPSGRMIRELGFEDAAKGWDGKRDDGNWADSGVYLILVTDPRGDSAVGKVAIIRE